jgi:hypothetical protein
MKDQTSTTKVLGFKEGEKIPPGSIFLHAVDTIQTVDVIDMNLPQPMYGQRTVSKNVGVLIFYFEVLQ